MNPFLETLLDPIWQILAVAIVLATPFFLIAVRTRDVHLSAVQKRQGTRLVLLVCLGIFVFMSGGEVLLHAQQAPSPQVGSRVFTSVPTSVPTPVPTLNSARRRPRPPSLPALSQQC